MRKQLLALLFLAVSALASGSICAQEKAAHSSSDLDWAQLGVLTLEQKRLLDRPLTDHHASLLPPHRDASGSTAARSVANEESVADADTERSNWWWLVPSLLLTILLLAGGGAGGGGDIGVPIQPQPQPPVEPPPAVLDVQPDVNATDTVLAELEDRPELEQSPAYFFSSNFFGASDRGQSFRLRGVSLTPGVDKRVSDHQVRGGFLSFSWIDSQLLDSTGSNDTMRTELGGFLLHHWPNRWGDFSLASLLSLSRQQFDINQTLNTGVALRNQTNGDGYSGSLAARQQFVLPGGDKVVGVTGSLEIRSESRDGYEVEAADGPAVVLADTSRTSERSLILDYSQVFSHRQAVLSPLLRLTLSNVSRDSETDVTTTAGLGLSATLPEGWAGFAYLQQTPDVFGERRWGIEFGIRREY